MLSTLVFECVARNMSNVYIGGLSQLNDTNLFVKFFKVLVIYSGEVADQRQRLNILLPVFICSIYSPYIKYYMGSIGLGNSTVNQAGSLTTTKKLLVEKGESEMELIKQ